MNIDKLLTTQLAIGDPRIKDAVGELVFEQSGIAKVVTQAVTARIFELEQTEVGIKVSKIKLFP